MLPMRPPIDYFNGLQTISLPRWTASSELAQGIIACTDLMCLTCFHWFKLQSADRIWFYSILYIIIFYLLRQGASIAIQLWVAWLNPTRQKANESPWKNDQTPNGSIRSPRSLERFQLWCCNKTQTNMGSRCFAIIKLQGWPYSILDYLGDTYFQKHKYSVLVGNSNVHVWSWIYRNSP